LTPDVAANALYVCPAASSVWDSVAMGLRPFINQLTMILFAAIILVFFGWCWALYQNLLKDKFEQKAFDNVWVFTKVLFWIAVVVTILIWTPNHYKSVHVNGAPGNYVLCEANQPGALAVKASAVKR
jgi:hypothetical protein